MTTADGDRAFEAPDLIEVMDEAVRYNRFLGRELAHWAHGAERILDFGAGNGRFCIPLARAGHRVSAVEPDAALRQSIVERGVVAREALGAFGADERFDGIYSINVIEHVENDEALLRDFFARLVPRGRLLLYVPAFQVLFSANDARVGHLRRYRRRDLCERVERAGFQVTRARYVDSIGFLAGLGYRFLGNRDGGLNVAAVRLYDRAVFPLSRLADRACQHWLGKNLLITALRPG